MAYYINAQKSRRWRLIHQYYEGGKRFQRALSDVEMAPLGFTRMMTLEEARDWAKKLGADEQIERKRHKILKLLDDKNVIESAFLPRAFVKRFEKDELFLRFANGDKKRLKSSKSMSHWRCAQKMVATLKRDPLNIYNQPEFIYNYCENQTWSLSYTLKLIRVLNLWARFMARETKSYFEEIPPPRGVSAKRIVSAYYKAKGRGKVSDRLLPDTLERAKSNFTEAQYRYLFIAIWFGLRPQEIDALKDKTSWRIEMQQNVYVLFIFQSKIITTHPDDAWKLIPALYPEQLRALDYIREGDLRRPLPKTCKLYLGGNIMNYGGRKAFERLMRERGHPLIHISLWLGHRDAKTTIQKYREELKVAM